MTGARRRGSIVNKKHGEIERFFATEFNFQAVQTTTFQRWIEVKLGEIER